MPVSPATKALTTMRNLMANGWTSEALLVDGAADVLVANGMDRERAQDLAQSIFNTNFKVMGPV